MGTSEMHYIPRKKEILGLVRRFQVFEHERDYVIKALYNKLNAMREIDDETEIVFRLLWRMMKRNPGKPWYPKLTKENKLKLLIEANTHLMYSGAVLTTRRDSPLYRDYLKRLTKN